MSRTAGYPDGPLLIPLHMDILLIWRVGLQDQDDMNNLYQTNDLLTTIYRSAQHSDFLPHQLAAELRAAETAYRPPDRPTGVEATTLVSTGRDQDTILVSPGNVAKRQSRRKKRSQPHSDLKQMMNQDLHKLNRDYYDPGITIERIAIASSLPDNAVDAFNAVLTASQKAKQTIAQEQKDVTLRPHHVH
ncbi:hypothetical protein HG548_18755 [Citrobacter sp. DNRA3]|uniref:SPFH domain-containing protein n=1 Tax=Citrobacter sp. DNRA3 TaxID=2723054 RepID=UPI001459B1A3|nr:hypothetical protein [Citrobacter sp. DNRA3]